jgi:hypothetical protein
MTEKTVNKAPSGRPNRKPVGFRNRLAVHDQDPNFVYRWVNTNADGGDRVTILEESGYEKVAKSAVRTGNGRVEASPLGGTETIPGGGGDTLVLMRQKKEWYEEDQKAKQARVDELDRAQKKTPEGFYGKISEK